MSCFAPQQLASSTRSMAQRARQAQQQLRWAWREVQRWQRPVVLQACRLVGAVSWAVSRRSSRASACLRRLERAWAVSAAMQRHHLQQLQQAAAARLALGSSQRIRTARQTQLPGKAVPCCAVLSCAGMQGVATCAHPWEPPHFLESADGRHAPYPGCSLCCAGLLVQVASAGCREWTMKVNSQLANSA